MAAVLALLAAGPPASAQPTAAATAANGESTFDIGRVVVTGQRRGPLSTRSLLTSVDVIHAEVLNAQAVQSTWELFSLVPGALLTHFNQGTTTGKVAMRGFNGEGNINAVKLLVDGVPSNSNDGNMPYLDAVMPLEMLAVEVVRGTNDARFGLHGIAGNINLVTRRGGNTTDARLGVGAFNSLDLQLAKGIESGGFSQNYFIGHKRSDGWRDHSDSEKTTLAGQWFANGRGWSVGATARWFTHDAQEAGYLTLAQARANPDQSNDFSATDGGKRQLGQLALHADWQAAAVLDVSAKLYVNRFDDVRFVKFSATVAQQERVTDETHAGARVALSWRPTLGGWHALAVEGGADLERQDNRSERYTAVERVRTAQTRDQAWTLNTRGLYAQAVLQPTASLKLVPGWRIDWLGGDFENRRNGVQAPMYDFGAVQQPKFSAVWQPLADTSVYANWGRTFQVGLGSASYKVPPLKADLQPSINTGWELGATARPHAVVDGRLAVWQQTATREWRRLLNDPNGDSANVGATRRRGVDLQLGLHPAQGLDAWATVTLQKATVTQPDPAAPATVGNEIDHVPRRLLNAGLDWALAPGWTLNAELQGQGDYYLDNNNNTGRFGGYTLVNLGAKWQPSPRWWLAAQLRNAANRATEYVWHDGSISLHSPGAPRALHLSAGMSL